MCCLDLVCLLDLLDLSVPHQGAVAWLALFNCSARSRLGCHGGPDQSVASCRALQMATVCTVPTREPVVSLHAVLLLP